MPGTIDDRYFEWLYSQVGSVRNRNPARSFWKLARKLYTTEFVWLVANDDNRVEDGKELRLEFMNEQGFDQVSPEWETLGCSVLEMLVALSRRAAFETDGSPVEWFGIFLGNLGLTPMRDDIFDNINPVIVAEILQTFIYRTYNPDGSSGGLFPLDHPYEDQRKVELWYQLAAYLLER